jgi:WD repeat-containing protein 35
MLAECLYRLEDYGSLSRLASALPDGDPLLLDAGSKLQSVGLATEAVDAFLRAGDPRRAVDACVTLHQWDTAMDLPARHNYPQACAAEPRGCLGLLQAMYSICVAWRPP